MRVVGAFDRKHLRNASMSSQCALRIIKYITLAKIALACVGCATPPADAKLEYQPGGLRFQRVWVRFYNGDHEPELDDPLIEAGKEMTPAICDAILHKDMRLRRYAISALGFIGDKRAIPALEHILKDSTELEYFRGDALKAIYQLNSQLGSRYAVQYEHENRYLTMVSDAIRSQASWLVAPTDEN
jgi:hypothetical protein